MTTKKNILIVAHHYPPHISGVGMVAHNQAKRLVAHGNVVTVVTSETSEQEKSGEVDGVDVIRIKALNFSESWSAPFPLFSPRLLPVLWRSVKNADIVHVHDAFYMSSFWAAAFARMQKKPIVLTQHVALIAHPSAIVVIIEKIVYATTGALIFRWSNVIMTYNNRVEQFLRDAGVPEPKLTTLVNGVDTDFFHPPAADEKDSVRARYGLNPAKKIILFIARFVPKKGFDKLLAAQDKDYQIVFAGGDATQENTEQVVFLGKLAQAQTAEVYRAADLFVLPSESEGFPLCIQEAMASGLPIITTNDEGYQRYHLDHSKVLLLDHPTSDSVRDAIKSVVHDAARLREMSAYSSTYARNNFSWPLVISQLEAIYDGLLATKKSAQTARRKIAIVSDAIYPFNKGGKEKRIFDISTRLAAQDFDVTIYCMKMWDGEDVIVRNGVTLHAISPFYPVYFKERRSISEAVLFALHCFKLLREDFDVVDVDHVPHPVLFTMKIVCLLKRKKMIATWHEVWGSTYWRQYLGNFKGSIAYAVERISVMLPNLIVSVSEHTTNDLRRVLGTTTNIVTLPNGLDIEMIMQSAPTSVKTDLVFAGRLLSHKNVDVLLRAVSIIKEKNPDVTLIVVGDGPEKENLEKLASDLGLQKNVSFPGFLESDRDLYGIMRSSKVFVSPSTREGFGITIIEANACGLPVVTIDDEHNAAKELIINNENGVLCTLDEHQLAIAIESILKGRKDPAFYEKYAAEYGWNKILPKIEQLYRT